MKNDIEKMRVRYSTKIIIEKHSLKKLNPQFSLCDVLVAYPDDNRNNTSIGKDVFENALYSLYGVPIVGEWVYKLDGTDEKTWGSHGGKIIMDSSGITFEETTKPYGFVTKESVENAEWITIVEKNGFTEKEYLKLSECILWTDRYEEAKSVLDENFGQSMEVEFTDGFYRDDGCFVANEMVFSALCILGTEHEPCFESASIGKYFELNQNYKKEFESIMQEVQYSLDKNKETEEVMVKKVIEKLSSFKIDCNGVEKDKYIVLSINEADVGVVDREDNYNVYTIPFSLEEDNITFNFNERVKKTLGVIDTSEYTIDIQKEVDDVSREVSAVILKTKEFESVNEITEKYEVVKTELNDLKAELKKAEEKILVFEQEKTEKEEREHRENIDRLVDSYSTKLESCPEFLIYRSKIDYSKTKEQIDTDLLILLGKYNRDSNNNKSKFSFNPVYTAINKDTEDNASGNTSRYGDIFERVQKN